MPWPVGHELYETAPRAVLGADPVEFVTDGFDDLQVGPLVAASDIIGLAGPALRRDHSKRPGMVIDIEPVPDIGSRAINRQRPAFEGIDDHERYELFRKMKRPVIIGTVGDNDRQAVGAVPGLGEMVRSGL